LTPIRAARCCVVNFPNPVKLSWIQTAPECEDCDCASQMPRDNNDPGAYPGPDPDCECECHG